MSTLIEKLIEEFEKGKKPKDLINEGYKKSTVYLAYKRYKERVEARKKPVIEVFRLLEEGKTLPKIVVETGLDPDEVKKYYEKWRELKEIDINQPILLKELEELKRALKPILEKKAIEKILAILNNYRIVKCPSCKIEFILHKNTPIGRNVTCPNGHSFSLRKDLIVLE